MSLSFVLFAYCWHLATRLFTSYQKFWSKNFFLKICLFVKCTICREIFAFCYWFLLLHNIFLTRFPQKRYVQKNGEGEELFRDETTWADETIF